MNAMIEGGIKAVKLAAPTLAAAVLIYLVPYAFLVTVGYDTIKEFCPFFRSPISISTNIYECEKISTSLQRGKTSGCNDFNKPELDLINSAQERILKGAETQFDLIKSFFKWQYFSTLSALIAGALSAMTLLAISIYGWASAPGWLKPSFFLCSASVAFWVAVPQVYRYEENISAALKRHALASTTLWQLSTIRATGRDADGNWVNPQKTLWNLTRQAGEAGIIGIAFDQNKAMLLKLEKPGQ
ncbi:hypothetical protein P3W85_17640 [Cupriavidus basilensis]|uniref:Uncharacterized protein n=1 Tax=Cupriavidus basilensis TaxID=68895 RepID=A0ABT6AQA8_9BURK|nr:hypothetical protein [Cupriavidus basilensis]MDF3834767.1 hypothetical protein [Cupriavidus basilensis]